MRLVLVAKPASSQQGDASFDRVILTRYFLAYHTTSHNAQIQITKNLKAKMQKSKTYENMKTKQDCKPRRRNISKQARESMVLLTELS